MKKPPDKNALRRELRRATDSFLAQGGKISQYPQGESAFAPGQRPPAAPLFTEPKSERTPVDDVIAALKARKAEKQGATRARQSRTPSRRKRVIYDDFGEPMRVIWSEE